MTPTLHLHPALPRVDRGGSELGWRARHVLLILPPVSGKRLPAELPAAVRALAQAAVTRRGLTPAALLAEGWVVQDSAGVLYSLCVAVPDASAFEQGTALRKALAPLLAEHPAALAIGWLVPAAADVPDAHGADADRADGAGAGASEAARAVFAGLVNGATLPLRKSGKPPRVLQDLHLFGVGTEAAPALARAEILAAANTLARSLTLLPPNELHPGAYRARIRKLARAQGWKIQELGLPQLRRLKAGAFLAVAQGSDSDDAAIVHLSWKPRGARRRLALVGKGICFDTGGHNLKNARGMYGMHEDMNGSAVALATFQAIAALQLPVEVHCFLALAQNHLSPRAYKQNDVVTALNGTTIEIVHTDAEGRMVLADALTLASREQPELIVDFATLTGSMVTALGTLQSGVIATRPELERLARAAALASGERVVCFSAEPDYDTALESKVADIKQCLQEGEADHLLAARFLNRFRGEGDWIHVDLSSYRHAGGLGAVASDVNGFGVAWACALIEQWLATPARAAGRKASL